MRFACGDAGGPHRFSQNTDLPISATELCTGRDVKNSTFAEFSVSFDFRLFQQYRPEADKSGSLGWSNSIRATDPLIQIDQCCRNVRKFLPRRRPHVTHMRQMAEGMPWLIELYQDY
jgi:hypothetical protein